MTAKQFIRRLAEMKLIPLPGNIDSRRFRFNHSAPARIEVFTVEEVRDLLGKAPERMRLYLLLMVQCGCYQNDIAELRQDEVDWKAGTIKRARSKTRERNGPVVTYKLWPETFELLRKYRSDGELVLTTEKGNPLVSYKLVDGKLKRYDAIQSAWTRMGKGRLGMKHLRKTAPRCWASTRTTSSSRTTSWPTRRRRWPTSITSCRHRPSSIRRWSGSWDRC